MHFYSLCALIPAAPESVPVLPGALLSSWTWPVLPLLFLATATVIYCRGWRLARVSRPDKLPVWRLAAFAGGVLTFWLAIASPIDAFDDYLLTAHMIQHFILMSVAPPLFVLSAPVVPMLRGLPRWVIHRILRVILLSPNAQKLAHMFTQPVAVWLGMNLNYLAWHAPMAFEATFRSEAVHNAEHLSFFFTSIAFWWVVLEPWPARGRWPTWAAIPYLLSADLINTILSALLTFSGRVVYPTYAAAPRITRLTPLQDQIAAGSEMWVLNSLVFVIPAIVILMRLLSPKALAASRRERLSVIR